MSTAIYLWSSQVALVVKNPRANAREINKERFIMQEINRTRVRSPIPGQEDPLEKGMATHPSILAWRIHMDKGAWWATVHGVAKSQI